MEKQVVLIVNLGTPDSTSWWDIRKYLKEFLSDRRVIEVNPIIWQIILNLFILTLDLQSRHMPIKKFGLKKRTSHPYYTLQEIKQRNFGLKLLIKIS